MAITTTTSIRVPKPTGPCVVCGHFGGLFVRTAQGQLCHFDDCSVDAPLGQPPEDPYTAIAHDPLGEPGRNALGLQYVHGSDIRALEALRAHGVGLTKEKSRPMFPEVHEGVGSFGPEVLELKTGELRRRMEQGEGGFKQVGLGPVLPPSAGDTRYGFGGKPD